MGLNFTPRTIPDGFIAMLHNVYYYTGRWGLSVRGFTGQHWKYWEQLPKKLRDAQGSSEAIESIISELETLASRGRERHVRREELTKKGGFRKKEVVINEQLLAILAALPHELLAKTFRRLTAERVLPAKALLVDRHLETGEQLIEPDFLVLGGRQLLMGELKVKADPLSGDTKYDANQLYNYLSLAVKCLSREAENLPNRFAHVILLPSVDLKWFVQGGQWIANLQSGTDRHMEFDIEATHLLARKHKNQRYIKDAEKLCELLTGIPVYCRSYIDLARSMEQATEGFPLADHWLRIHAELLELAEFASAGLLTAGLE